MRPTSISLKGREQSGSMFPESIASARTLLKTVILIGLADRASFVLLEWSPLENDDESANDKVLHVWKIYFRVAGEHYEMVPASGEAPIGRAAWQLLPPWQRIKPGLRLARAQWRRLPLSITTPLLLTFADKAVFVEFGLFYEDPHGPPRIEFRFPEESGCAEAASAEIKDFHAAESN